MDLGSVSLPAEDVIHHSTAATTETTAFLLAARCVATPAEEPSVTVCVATASTATTDENKKTADD